MRKRHVSNDSLSKESGVAILRAVEELVWYQKCPRTQIVFQRTDSAHGNNTLHAQKLHGINVRAVIDFAWQNAVPAAVACQKRHALSFQSTEHDSVRRDAEGRLHANLARGRQSAPRVDA